jgi:hypothetical protein
MAEQQEVAKRTIQVKNVSPTGMRWVFDAAGKQHNLGPGQEAEVEVAEPVAKNMEEASKAGADLRVSGQDPEPKDGPEIPEEQKSRSALAEAEANLIEEGQEADKERREKDAKKSGEQLAAETGIHMHARGQAPDVVTRPADAPPKKKA